MQMWYSGIHHIPMARTRSVVLLVLFTLFLSFSCNGVLGNRGLHNNNKLAKKSIQVRRPFYLFLYVYIFMLNKSCMLRLL